MSSFVPGVGGILSADIAVRDHASQVRFYARVLTTGDAPLWRDDLMNRRGFPVLGLGERTEAHASLPTQWMPHIQVEDVGASVTKALGLGGRELMHGRDAAGRSQWAVLADPAGATFGLIPVVPADAIPSSDDPLPAGHIAWADLTVGDATGLRDFYCAVVGYTVEACAMSDADGAYHDFTLVGGQGAAVGICHARGANRDLPAVWMLYVPVGDLHESLQRVRDEGGSVLKGPMSIGTQSAAVIRDPLGVAITLVG